MPDEPALAARRRRLTFTRRPAPTSALASRWTSVEGVKVHFRESPGPPDGATMMHLHGFGLSGRYLLPTAELLAGEFRTLVPDLPASGAADGRVSPSTCPSWRTPQRRSSTTGASS